MECPICQKEFHHLGIASHRAACRRKKLAATIDLINKFNSLYPIGSKVVFRITTADPHEEMTVRTAAFEKHSQAVVFFEEHPSYCSIDPMFIKYPS